MNKGETEMLELNLAKAKELIGLAIDEYGADYVYPYDDCQYVLNAGDVLTLNSAGSEAREVERYSDERILETVPGCGVGVALHKAGIPLGQMGFGSDAHGLLGDLAERGLVKYTKAASEYLNTFQGQQDTEQTWKIARQVADKHLTDKAYIYSDTF